MLKPNLRRIVYFVLFVAFIGASALGIEVRKAFTIFIMMPMAFVLLAKSSPAIPKLRVLLLLLAIVPIIAMSIFYFNLITDDTESLMVMFIAVIVEIFVGIIYSQTLKYGD